MEDALPSDLSLQLEAANEKTSSDRLIELAKTSAELAQLVANNPCATPELLRELANSSDATTRKNVAGNPNTPIEALQQLGDEYPKEVLANSVLPLLFLENPKILDAIFQENILWNMVLDAYTPTQVLAMLVYSNHTQVAEAARLHVNLAGEMTSGWDEAAREAIGTIAPGYHDREYTKNLANRGLIPEFVIVARHEDKKLRGYVASNPNTSIKLLDDLAQDDDRYVRSCVASNPSTPIKFLERLAHDDDRNVRRCVASNPNTPIEILEQFVQDEDYYARRGVASNPNTPVRFLERLAQDDDKSVRSCIGKNSNTPVNLLECLAQDKEKDVFNSVISNPNTPVKLLEPLAQDKNKYVRRYFAQNPNIPATLLERLAQDKDKSVRSAVAKNPNTSIRVLERLAQDKDKSIRCFVVRNPNTPVKVLEQLVQADYNNVCNWIAQNPNTPVKVLEQLVQEKDSRIRENVAKHPNTPVKLLEQLAQDKVSNVRWYVAQNPNTPINLCLELMLKDYGKNSTPSLNRFLLLLHPETSAKSLADNLRSEAWLERYAIAQHSSTPVNTLKTLAKDANRIVRAAAKANLESRCQQP